MLLNPYRFALLLMALTAAGAFFLTTFFVILDDAGSLIVMEALDVVAVDVDALPELPADAVLALGPSWRSFFSLFLARVRRFELMVDIY